MLQVRSFEPGPIHLKGRGGRELDAAADIPPGTGYRREQPDGPRGHRAPLRALHPVIQAYGRWPGRGILPRQGHDVVRGNSGEFRRPARCPFPHPRFQGLEAEGVPLHVIAILQTFSGDHVHHRQSQCRVRPRPDCVVPVGLLPGPVPVRIDRVELRPVSPRLHDERPQVHIRSEDVRAPGEDQLCVAKLLRFNGVPHAQGLRHTRRSRARTDRAVQTRSAQGVEEPSVHAGTVQITHCPGVAVGQNRLRAMLARGRRQSLRDLSDRVVPTDPRELSLSLCACPYLGIQQPIRRVFPLQISCYLTAEEALRHRMSRISPQPRTMTVLIHIDQQRACVRTVQSADRVQRPFHFLMVPSGRILLAADTGPYSSTVYNQTL